MIKSLVTKQEEAILDDIADIGYGEISEVLLPREEPSISYELSPRQEKFIKTARTGVQFKTIVIHDGEPAYAEYEGISSGGFKVTFKVKF